MPMSRVNDVSFEHSGILDRVLRCGTLVVESAGERGQLVMRDVPHVEEVQRDIYRLAEADEERRRADYPDEAFGGNSRSGPDGTSLQRATGAPVGAAPGAVDEPRPRRRHCDGTSPR
jgi:hypothetical protein